MKKKKKKKERKKEKEKKGKRKTFVAVQRNPSYADAELNTSSFLSLQSKKTESCYNQVMLR